MQAPAAWLRHGEAKDFLQQHVEGGFTEGTLQVVHPERGGRMCDVGAQPAPARQPAWAVPAENAVPVLPALRGGGSQAVSWWPVAGKCSGTQKLAFKEAEE